MPVILRPAEMTDSDFLFKVANAPSVREWSKTLDAITPEQHADYMEAHLAVPAEHRKLFVFILHDESGVRPIGYGRIDPLKEERGILTMPSLTKCRLSYALPDDMRGKGYGLQAVTLLVERAKRFGYTDVGIEVKRENIVSMIVAMRAGVNGVRFL